MSGAIGSLAIGLGGIGVSDSASASYLGPDPGLNRLLDNIQIEVAAVTQDVIQLMAWNVIEDFYIRSNWRRERVFWTMAPGIGSIDFNPFDQTFIVSWVLSVSGLASFTVRPPALLVDLRAADTLRTGEALIGLKPVSFAAITAASVAPELWSTWFDVIRYGVLARLYAMPAKPYSSPQLASVYIKQYRAGVAAARGIADSGFNGSPGGRWAFPQFANGRRKN